MGRVAFNERHSRLGNKCLGVCLAEREPTAANIEEAACEA